ncbi:hypothetical protein F8M41_005504 [Gigaspora margarita]|uniref:Uncharacterized protein n=1 Tax=Gigaspora margarita TaxID=4874 RepID=A0A8H4AX59_GIGMA|nr:hypothetical protein F8M41_005504 [Gigaspora margarita]
MVTIIRSNGQNSELIIKEGRKVASYGAHVCKSGLITRVTCGFVKAFITVSTRKNGAGMIENLIYYGKDTSEISSGGDSRCPVFTYSRDLITVGLVGIHVKRLTVISEYLPLEVILNRSDVELVVS